LFPRQHRGPSWLAFVTFHAPDTTGQRGTDSVETNHERTLYVRYLFRNPLI
jgi:hypothetical protein